MTTGMLVGRPHHARPVGMLLVAWLLAAHGIASAAEPPKPPAVEPPTPNSADEPLAKQLSLVKAAEFLDRASLHWTTERKCGTCHTNYAYMMARPSLSHVSQPAV